MQTELSRSKPTKQCAAFSPIAAINIVDNNIERKAEASMNPLKIRNVTAISLTKGRHFKDVAQLLKRSFITFPITFYFFRPRQVSEKLFVKNCRKYTANHDKDPDHDGEGPRSMNNIRKHSLIVHDLKEPGRDKPGNLSEKVAEPLQSGPLMIIRCHFIPERDPGNRITGKGNDKETLDH